jgi:hypothetical protein
MDDRPQQNPDQAHPFEREAATVLAEQRSSLAGVLDQLRPPITRPTDLNRLLKLNHKLSWLLFNAAQAEDERALAAFLPGRRPMERFFEAAARHGVAEDAIARARAAFARYEETVQRHGGGNRDLFQSMVADLDGGGEEAVTAAAELRHKRSMFRAASVLFGRQARVSFGALVVAPSAQPGLVDSISIKGMLGLHKTRRGVPLQTLVHHLRLRTQADPALHGVPEALDPREAGHECVGLLRDFCSTPLPTFRSEPSSEGSTTLEMTAPGVGSSSSVRYFIGHIVRAAEARPGSTPGSATVLTKGYEVPAEVDIADVLMHESLWDEQVPEVKVYKWPTLGWTAPLRQSDLLPMKERAQHLGRGPYAGRTPHVPEYEGMMSYVLERAGWMPQQFRLFRCAVEYPVMHTRLRMVFARGA